ncbi:MAG: MFS transporter [Deltaproteobacteria bacterium]|nr:MFS transporter [Candidatus Zymogenaceae bacterium]
MNKDPRKDASINALALTIFATNIGGGIILAIIALYTDYLNINIVLGGLVIALFAITRVVAQPVIGHYIDRMDPRPVITVGIILFIIASAAPAVPNVTVLFISRGIQGIGSGLVIVACYTIIARRYLDGYLRRIANARFMVLEMVGAVLGPVVGAFVFWASGSFSSPFVVCSMFGLIALALFIKNYQEIGGERTILDHDIHAGGKNGIVFAPSGFWILLMVMTMIFVIQFVWGSLQFIMPLYAVSPEIALPQYTVGFLFGALSSGMIVTVWMLQRELFGRISSEVLILIGSTCSLIGLTVFIITADFWIWFATFLFIGCGAGLLFPIFPTLASEAIVGQPGRGVSYMETGGNIGFILGPILAGWLAGGAEYLRAFYFEIGAAYLLLMTAVGLILIRKRSKTATE